MSALYRTWDIPDLALSEPSTALLQGVLACVQQTALWSTMPTMLSEGSIGFGAVDANDLDALFAAMIDLVDEFVAPSCKDLGAILVSVSAIFGDDGLHEVFGRLLNNYQCNQLAMRRFWLESEGEPEEGSPLPAASWLLAIRKTGLPQHVLDPHRRNFIVAPPSEMTLYMLTEPGQRDG